MNDNIKDPFVILYAEIQNVWNDKKGLDFNNLASRKRIFNRLKKFANSLPSWSEKLLKEISILERIYNS